MATIGKPKDAYILVYGEHNNKTGQCTKGVESLTIPDANGTTQSYYTRGHGALAQMVPIPYYFQDSVPIPKP